MGLAGPRKRTKISHDPNNTNWSRSANNFGHKILTAQGWITGTFLGAKDAPHAQLHSAASASHIRVALKDDNLGLGAKRGSGQVEGECTGLSSFQELLGRLNGKTKEEVNKEQKYREDLWREVYMENRWGLIKFVKGGFLVEGKIQELADDKVGRLQVPIVAKGHKTSKAAAGSGKLLEGTKRGKVEKWSDEGSDDRWWPICDKADKVKVQEKKVKSQSAQKGKQSGSPVHCIEGQSLPTRQAYTKTTITQSPTDSNLSLSEEKKRMRSRRLARRTRKGIKCQVAKEQVAAGKGRDRSGQSSSVRDPLFRTDVIDSVGSEKVNASSSIPTGMLPRGRHVIRQRYIQQKKMALSDVQALNEILMIKA